MTTLFFLGESENSWLINPHKHNPVEEAREYLLNIKISKKFNGGLVVANNNLPVFIKHLSWLTKCNAAFPIIYFTDSQQNILGHMCQYGNLHIDTLNKSFDTLMPKIVEQTVFTFQSDLTCGRK